MIGIEIGKRYERLLFFTAPISLAAIVVCLVAIASTKQDERVQARCYAEASSVFRASLPSLEAHWNKTKRKNDFWYIDYWSKLSHIWIEGSGVDGCYGIVRDKIKELERSEPSKIVQSFEDERAKLSKLPLSVYGITLPNDASVDLLLTKITINLLTLSKILQVVLLPVILLWLGSLYTTRYRESIIVARAGSLTDVFPHIINLYPAFDMPSVRKRSWIAPHFKEIMSFIYAITRIALLSIFILPPIAAYLYSLFLIGEQNFSIPYLIAGIVVGIFAFTTLIAELLPAHVSKVFPDPTKERQL